MMQNFLGDIPKILALLLRVAILLAVVAYLWPEAVRTVGGFFFPAEARPLDDWTEIYAQWIQLWQYLWQDAIKGILQLYVGS